MFILRGGSGLIKKAELAAEHPIDPSAPGGTTATWFAVSFFLFKKFTAKCTAIFILYKQMARDHVQSEYIAKGRDKEAELNGV